MRTFLEFIEQDLNDVLDFIAEDFQLNEDEGNPQQQHKEKQPWPDFEAKQDNKQYSHEEFKKYYNKHVKPHVDKVQSPFHKLLHSAKTGGADVMAAKKRLDTMHDKVVLRNKPASEMHDVVRGAILTKNKEDAEKVVNKLKETGKVIHHEYKNHEQDGKESGYGGTHHLTVDVKGVHTEVQVMPKKIFNAKKEGHRLYKKYRNLKNPEQHPDYQKDMAKSRSIFKNAVEKSR